MTVQPPQNTGTDILPMVGVPRAVAPPSDVTTGITPEKDTDNNEYDSQELHAAKIINSNDMAKLIELTHDDIEAYILDPKNNPLPPELQEQFDRVMTAARLLDDYPDDSHIIALLAHKYRASITTFRKDIALAKQVYKTKHTFDWDFWFMWQIKDQLELIRKCKLQGRLKEWNAAKKVLHQIIGDKPEGIEDPTRMQHTNVYIQVVNNNGSSEYRGVNEVHDLRPDEVQELLEVLNEPIDDAQAEEIMNS